MSNIQFDEGQFRSNQSYQSPDEKGMVGWLIKKGVAKDAKTANIILVVFAIICFVVTFWTFPKENTGAVTEQVAPEYVSEEEI